MTLQNLIVRASTMMMMMMMVVVMLLSMRTMKDADWQVFAFFNVRACSVAQLLLAIGHAMSDCLSPTSALYFSLLCCL